MKTLLDLLATLPKNQWNRAVRKNKEWVSELRQKYPATSSLNEQLFLVSNNLEGPPKCAVSQCNDKVKWINDNHYGETCSHRCAQQLRKENGRLQQISEKLQNTNLARYGVSNPNQNPEVLAKRKETLLSRYGALVSPATRESARQRSRELNRKGRETFKNRYGVANPSQLPDHLQKVQATLQKNYGVSHQSQIPHVQAKTQHLRESRFHQLAENQVKIIAFHEPDDELTASFDNPNQRIEFHCLTCSSVETLASETFKFRTREFGSPCSTCTCVGRASSNQEMQVRDFVKTFGTDVVANDRKQIAPYELDIWLPSQRVAIEYCGLYFHKEHNIEDRKRHLKKHEMCAEKNIRLVTIFEDEWVNNRAGVENRLRNLLQANSQKIGARKLACTSISPQVANEFCEKYHIQGVGRTRVAYGLFQAAQLVSVMTFSHLNIAKGSKHSPGAWELNRFCSIFDLTISGGASKLFSNFINDHSPEQVISYSDRRWNTGAVYAKLGFDFAGHSPPNYWYIDFGKLKRIHRYALKKNKCDDLTLTEWETRQQQGWSRIWDCGHGKWIWRNKKAEQ